MKITKLSLVAALAVNAAFAGGDIAPVEPAIKAPVAITSTACNSQTTVNGKAQLYSYTTDAVDFFDKDSSAVAAGVTLNVAHKLSDNITANFTAVGNANFGNKTSGYMESHKRGSFFNIANLTGTFGDTTVIAGRQLIDSPMFGSFDWLLAPSSFEAYTLVNGSISNVTLVGTYVREMRANNTGNAWVDLTDINDGNNYALGAVYGADALNASVWYYNIDAGDYTQVYTDAGYNFGMANLAAQFATTDYATTDDSTAYGVKVGTEIAGINLTAAMNMVSDATTGFVERDALYTSSWNTMASTIAVANDDTLSWKVGASTELSGLNAELSYAGYGDDGSELDLILGYDVTPCTNLAAIYTSTTANTPEADALNALELVGTYKF